VSPEHGEERGDDLRIELSGTAAHQFRRRIVRIDAGPIAAVLRHRVVRVDDGDDPGGERDVAPGDLARVSAATELLVRRANVGSGLAEGESVVYSEKSAREFAFDRMPAIILSDGSSEGSQKPNFLLPPKGWKEERLYEAASMLACHDRELIAGEV